MCDRVLNTPLNDLFSSIVIHMKILISTITERILICPIVNKLESLTFRKVFKELEKLALCIIFTK